MPRMRDAGRVRQTHGLYELATSIPPFNKYKQLGPDLQDRTKETLEARLHIPDSVLHNERFRIAFLRLWKARSKRITHDFEGLVKGDRERAITELTWSIPEHLNGLLRLALVSRSPVDYLTLIANLNPSDKENAIRRCSGFFDRTSYPTHTLSKQELAKRESEHWKFGVIKGDTKNADAIKRKHETNSVISTGVFLLDWNGQLELIPFDRWVVFGDIEGYLLNDSKVMSKVNVGGCTFGGDFFVVHTNGHKHSTVLKQKIQHELNHLFDDRFGIEGDNPTHEYRAMLAELAFAEHGGLTLQHRYDDLHSRIHEEKVMDSVIAIGFLLSQFGSTANPLAWQKMDDKAIRDQATELLNAAYKGICGLKYKDILAPLETR